MEGLASGRAAAGAAARAQAAEAAAAAARSETISLAHQLHDLRLALASSGASLERAAELARGGGSLTFADEPFGSGAVSSLVADLNGKSAGAAAAALAPERGRRGAPALSSGAACLAVAFESLTGGGCDAGATPRGGEEERAPSVPATPSPAKAARPDGGGAPTPPDAAPLQEARSSADAAAQAAPTTADASTQTSPDPAAADAAATIAALEARLALDDAQLMKLAAALEAAAADRAELQAALATAGAAAAAPHAPDTAAAALSARAVAAGRQSAEGEAASPRRAPPPPPLPRSPMATVPGLTDEELEVVRVRDERDTLMEALVAKSVALAERDADCVRARRALARAADVRMSAAAALDGVAAAVAGASPAGVDPAVAAALARARGGLLQRAASQRE